MNELVRTDSFIPEILLLLKIHCSFPKHYNVNIETKKKKEGGGPPNTGMYSKVITIK